jgi:hypothetical protein
VDERNDQPPHFADRANGYFSWRIFGKNLETRLVGRRNHVVEPKAKRRGFSLQAIRNRSDSEQRTDE